MKTDKYVGLDVHKDTITVAVAQGGRTGEVRLFGKISNDFHALERLLANAIRPAARGDPTKTLATRTIARRR